MWTGILSGIVFGSGVQEVVVHVDVDGAHIEARLLGGYVVEALSEVWVGILTGDGF